MARGGRSSSDSPLPPVHPRGRLLHPPSQVTEKVPVYGGRGGGVGQGRSGPSRTAREMCQPQLPQ